MPGITLPEQAEEDLRKLVEALKQRKLEVKTMAIDVLDPTNPQSKQVANGQAANNKQLRMTALYQN